MIHWLRFSVKADNLQVYHLCPALPTAADRIYIRYTYQTPLSHLLTRWWLPNLPKPGSSSQHHTTSLRLQIEMREWMRERCKKKKKITLADIIPTLRPFFLWLAFVCVFHPTYFCTFLLWLPPLSLFLCHLCRLPSYPGSSPYRCMFNTGWGTPLSLPAKTIGGRDNPLL